jgi:diguanylate cyclase (GGDEF)-like protein
MVGVIAILSLLGFTLIKRIVDPIISLSSDIKTIASGELSHHIDIARDDEIGELSDALNQLTQHIKNNMDELKIYGERTKDINQQINKQVIALSGLLEISNLITKKADLKDVSEITISRLAQVASSSMAFLLFQKEGVFEVMSSSGLRADILTAMRLTANAYLFNGLLNVRSPFKADCDTVAESQDEVLKFFNAKNLLIYPIVVQGKPVGILGMGNQLEGFRFSEEDAELMGIFAKQLAIALENDFLARKVKELEIRDSLTGLFNKRYILARLEEEILRAISHQKPCSFIVLQLKGLADLGKQYGDAVAEDILKKVSAVLKTCIGELDRLGRIEDDELAMVLSGKNKKMAQEVASLVREKVEMVFQGEDIRKKPHIHIAVVENPIDGVDSVSLLEKAKKSLKRESEV